jgi:hypothetical protein
MHAAASYAHTDLLEYLISVGGDVNLRDDDGDTPLYVVESVEMARWLVERGADVGVVNEEGLSVSCHSGMLLGNPVDEWQGKLARSDLQSAEPSRGLPVLYRERRRDLDEQSSIILAATPII